MKSIKSINYTRDGSPAPETLGRGRGEKALRVHKLFSDGFSRKVKSECSEKGKSGMTGEEKLI